MYKSETQGKGGIYAKVVADSISEVSDVRLTTLELHYPRFIHSEFMTHRMFSRNASSSRAIPVAKMIEQVKNYPAMPIHWGKNQPGMQAKEECKAAIDIGSWDTGPDWHQNYQVWAMAAEECIYYARLFTDAGYHKQIVNRLLEPFQFITVVVTATEWDNFFKLRMHPDAQPEIQELARCMKKAMTVSEPYRLEPGQYHTPYVGNGYSLPEGDFSIIPSLEDNIKCSVARCARVSYLNHDKSEPAAEKDKVLHDDLLSAGHMSPFEHVATPMRVCEGVTHTDNDDYYWSGNFREWAQYRQLL